ARQSDKPEGKEILINVGPVEKRVAVMKGGELEDFFLEREGLEQSAGSIYKGRVSSVIPGIEAAFVDIGMEKNGFLHVSDVLDKGTILKEMLLDEDEPEVRPSRPQAPQRITDILKQGQEILVQVVKEAISTKGPRLTSYISIPGRYIVLTPFDGNIGISRRISDRDERKRIRDIIAKMKIPEGMGCIVRTVAEKRSEEELHNELKYLLNLWDKVKNRAERQRAPVRVYEEYGIVLRMIRDNFTADVTQLVVDSKEEYERITKFLRSFMPALTEKVKHYTGRVSLFQKFDLEKRIDEIFERKVHLKSGGSLVIEQTESLVAIDVNTGSFVGRNNLEETAFKTNMEAAAEVPRQLKLRDIGGIIIIDFIDMDIRDHRDKVFNRLQQELQDDKARINVRAISQFGVVEMTRQRMRKSIESTSHIECPYCAGKGVIKSAETIAIETVRDIDRILSHADTKYSHLSAISHPDVNVVLLSNQAKMLSDIQRKYRCKIDLKEDSTLHIEDVIIKER
ncbi:MAG: Rne/Rng family ribonuclease, partial [Candidatus Omnitrophica bacterium]|nr:Rne/Rng family ribonuclease [Candidatus Omnitrophota bacterium]